MYAKREKWRRQMWGYTRKIVKLALDGTGLWTSLLTDVRTMHCAAAELRGVPEFALNAV